MSQAHISSTGTLTITQVLQETLLAGEVQAHFDHDGEGGCLPRLQRKLGQGFFQLPAQEVTIQLLCNDKINDNMDGGSNDRGTMVYGPTLPENSDARLRKYGWDEMGCQRLIFQGKF